MACSNCYNIFFPIFTGIPFKKRWDAHVSKLRKGYNYNVYIYILYFDEARHYSTLSNAWLSNPPRYLWSSCCKQCPRCLHAAIPNVPRMQFLQPNEPSCKTCHHIVRKQKHACWNKKTQTSHENDAKSLLLPSKFVLLSGRLEHTSHLKFSSCALEKCYKRYRPRLQTSPRIFISAFHSILCTSHYHRQGILFCWREHSNMTFKHHVAWILQCEPAFIKFFIPTTGL